ncbi:MAG TPA: FkbM family methyltransferase, partial [Acidimicrobiales bacterium]
DGLDARYRTIKVRLCRLDDVASSFPGRVAVVKIDVEGHEDFVLRGGRRMIAADRPVIVAEWNPAYHHRRGTDPTERLHAAMAGLGYRSVRREGYGWIAGDRFHSPRDIDNLVMCPHERTHEVLAALSGSKRT